MRNSNLLSLASLFSLILISPFFASHLFGQEFLKKEDLKDAEVGDHWIYDDWEAALKLAKKEKKPIFALFR